MTWEDYDQAPGWHQDPLPVHRARPRRLGLVNWRHRKLKPLWYRALRSRGSLRRAA